MFSKNRALDYEFEVQEPEAELEHVSSPQMLVAITKSGHLKVTIYFMANTDLEITSGIAKSTVGKAKLEYTTVTPSGAYTSSGIVTKSVFHFC